MGLTISGDVDGVGMKKLLGGVAIAFALFYLLTQPAGAADVVKGAGGVVGDAFNAVISFFNALTR
jgi:hypothetical protein